MRTIAHVGGIKGVGKTTVLKRFIEVSKSDFEYVNIGELMDEYAKTIYGIDFYRLKPENRDEIRLRMNDIIKSYGKVVLDSHYTVRENGKVVRVFPRYGLSIVDMYILLIASPESTFERRMRDTRVRDLDLETIKEEARKEMDVYKEIVQLTKKQLYIVENVSVEQSVADLIGILCD